MQVNSCSPVQNTRFCGKNQEPSQQYVNMEMENDSFESSVKKPPKIGFCRLLFSRLTKDQIAQVNETKELPNNAKIVERNRSGYHQGPRLTWNIFNVTPGTNKLPAGYELKNDILGFTHVVREGTKSIIYKN